MKNQLKPNVRLCTLLHLKQMDEEAEGKMHLLSVLFPELASIEKWEIFKDLADAGFIKLERDDLPFDSELTNNRSYRKFARELQWERLWGKITFPGSLYLKDELEMQKRGNYNINYIDWSNKKIIIDNLNNNKVFSIPDCMEIIDQIIKTINTDNFFTKEENENLIKQFGSIKNHVEHFGELSEEFEDNYIYFTNNDEIKDLVYLLIYHTLDDPNYDTEPR